MSVFNIATVRPAGGAAGPVAVPAGPAAVPMGGPGAAPPAPAGQAAGTIVSQQGVFVTPQTIASFAGATLAVSMMWKVSGVIRPGLESEPWVALIASALVGIVLYLISESDPARGPVNLRERLIGIFVAFINTLVLFFAAIGAMTTAH